MCRHLAAQRGDLGEAQKAPQLFLLMALPWSPSQPWCPAFSLVTPGTRASGVRSSAWRWASHGCTEVLGLTWWYIYCGGAGSLERVLNGSQGVWGAKEEVCTPGNGSARSAVHVGCGKGTAGQALAGAEMGEAFLGADLGLSYSPTGLFLASSRP